MTVSRRDLIMRGGLAALGAAVAVPSLGATPDLEAAVREVIADIRALPGSTIHCVYVAQQDLADRLERLAAAAS